MDVLEFRNQLMDLMRDVSVNISSAFLPIINQHDLTIIQAQILREVKDNDGHSIGSLAKIMNIQNGNTSAMCKQLERKGYLQRTRDKSDERVVNIELTHKGISAIDEIDRILKEKYADLLTSEDPDNLRTVLCGLEILKNLLIKMNET